MQTGVSVSHPTSLLQLLSDIQTPCLLRVKLYRSLGGLRLPAAPLDDAPMRAGTEFINNCYKQYSLVDIMCHNDNSDMFWVTQQAQCFLVSEKFIQKNEIFVLDTVDFTSYNNEILWIMKTTFKILLFVNFLAFTASKMTVGEQKKKAASDVSCVFCSTIGVCANQPRCQCVLMTYILSTVFICSRSDQHW